MVSHSFRAFGIFCLLVAPLDFLGIFVRTKCENLMDDQKLEWERGLWQRGRTDCGNAVGSAAEPRAGLISLACRYRAFLWSSLVPLVAIFPDL